jgi:putative peptidoglycan lipid II flippase
MTFALASVAVNAALAIGLFNLGMGVAGIAAAVSASAWVNALLLAGRLWRRDLYRPSAAAISRLARILLASAGLGVVVALASAGRALYEAPIADLLAGIGATHGAKEISLLLVTSLGGLVYVVLAFATRAVTVAEVKGLLRRTAK